MCVYLDIMHNYTDNYVKILEQFVSFKKIANRLMGENGQI